MGRQSKLTEAQWEKLGKRLLAGEKAADLAREFDVSKTSISVRFSKRNETVKTVANQIVTVEQALANLTVSEQIAARTLADDLKAISSHLASAAKFSAATAHRVSGIAHGKAAEIDDAAPLDDKSRQALGDVAALTKLANAAAEIPLNLIRANKETIDEMNRNAQSSHEDALDILE
jgi:hypothetical protein